MRISTVGLFLVAAILLGACVNETSVYRSPDGRTFYREGYVEGAAPPAVPPATSPPTPTAEPVPSR
jgi:hypothetical protein